MEIVSKGINWEYIILMRKRMTKKYILKNDERIVLSISQSE